MRFALVYSEPDLIWGLKIRRFYKAQNPKALKPYLKALKPYLKALNPYLKAFTYNLKALIDFAKSLHTLFTPPLEYYLTTEPTDYEKTEYQGVFPEIPY